MRTSNSNAVASNGAGLDHGVLLLSERSGDNAEPVEEFGPSSEKNEGEEGSRDVESGDEASGEVQFHHDHTVHDSDDDARHEATES